jgi:hypothetical protein
MRFNQSICLTKSLPAACMHGKSSFKHDMFSSTLLPYRPPAAPLQELLGAVAGIAVIFLTCETPQRRLALWADDAGREFHWRKTGRRSAVMLFRCLLRFADDETHLISCL